MRAWLLVLLLIALGGAEALSCQYTLQTAYPYTVHRYSTLDGKPVNVSGQVITLTEPRRWKENIGFTYDYEFIVRNNAPVNVNATMFYSYNSTSAEYQIWLGPFGFQRISGQYQQGAQGPNLTNASVILNNVLDKEEILTGSRLECKKCLQADCLNDGANCTADSECGSGVCSIAGQCGKTKIVNCPEGFDNCNGQACLAVGAKANGEGFKCAWECKTGYGKLTCMENPAVIFGRRAGMLAKLALIVLGCILTALAAHYYRNKDEMRFRRLARQVDDASREHGKASIELAELKEGLGEISKDLIRLKASVYPLDTDIRLSEGNKTVYRTELLAKQAALQAKLQSLQQAKARKEKQLISLKSSLAGLERLKAKVMLKWEKARPYRDMQAGHQLVVYNPYLGGYKCLHRPELKLKDYPPDSTVQIWVWTQRHDRPPRSGHHIEHKDGNIYNNSADNLREVAGEEPYEQMPIFKPE